MASPPSFLLCSDAESGVSGTPPRRRSPPLTSDSPPPPSTAGLSLNERLQLQLSRSRPLPTANPNPSQEPEFQKVKVDGCRRLCKLATAVEEGNEVTGDSDELADFASPLLQNESSAEDDKESIRDILDDLSSRLDSLSMGKPKAELRPNRAPVACDLTEMEKLGQKVAADKGRMGIAIATPINKNFEEIKTRKESTGIFSDASPLAGNASLILLSHSNKKVAREGKGKPLFVEDEEEDEERMDFENVEEGSVDYKGKRESKDNLKEIKEREAVKRINADTSRTSSSVASPDEFSKNQVAYEEKREPFFTEEEDKDYLELDNVEDMALDLVMEGTGKCKSDVYRLSGMIAKKLYPHQREGLVWLWSLHCRGTGGILGDDMGLGKTMQIAAFLAGHFHSHLIKRALVVAPKTLLAHWTKELSVVGLQNIVRDYSGTSNKAREYELTCTLKDGGILLTTYDIVRINYKSIAGKGYAHVNDEDELLWDYVILDEGHVIKNPNTQRAQSLYEVPSAHRIVISGTPIQNNLKEMWALFNFCCPEVLGDKNEFKARYENPILRGSDKNASNREKHIGSTVAKELRERIKPYFLRRLKSEVFLESGGTENVKLSKKNEIIVWLRLTTCQRQLYEAFLNSGLVHSSLQGSPLAAITILKKICDHPLLLTKKAAEGVLEGIDSMLNNQEANMVEKMATSLLDETQSDSSDLVGQAVSCKLSFILSLLKNLVADGHCILIFSQTRKMLNLIQDQLISEGYKYLRIDGTTKVSDREKTVKEFQEGGAPIFLLTTQVGGLGLTLTKADRVIVVDPAWNPSTDNQSVDRAYRIGQTRDVLVYRLITCGTVEEKIYKMQVFKGGLFKIATEKKEQMRYFSKRDIQELFSLPEHGFDVSITQKQMQEEHGTQHVLDKHLVAHFNFLEKQGIAGVSHHSLLYSKTAHLPPAPDNDESERKIQQRAYWPSYSRKSNDEYVAHGEDHALKPNEMKYIPRTSPSSSNGELSPGEIQEKIKRLMLTLANTALVSKLPDRGEKLRRQIDELEQKLQSFVVEISPDSTERSVEVISIDDLGEQMQSRLFV